MSIDIIKEALDLYKRIKKNFLSYSTDDNNINKNKIMTLLTKYKYIPYPFDIVKKFPMNLLFEGLEYIWKSEGLNINDEKSIENFILSPPFRYGYTNGEWVIKNQHKIETITLTGLSEIKEGRLKGCFKNLLVKILTTPKGNKKKKILPTSFYILPFFKRDFNSAYCPISSEINPNIIDEKLERDLNIDGETQIKLFIIFSQLAGHPIILDILPQTGRFSKVVFTYPECFKWFDIKFLLNEYIKWLNDNINTIKDEYIKKVVYKAIIEDLKGTPPITSFCVISEEESLRGIIRSIYHYVLNSILLNEKEKNNSGLSLKELKKRFDSYYLAPEYISKFNIPPDKYNILIEILNNFIDINFAFYPIKKGLTDSQLSFENQKIIIKKVKETISNILESNIKDENKIKDDERLKLISLLKAKGLWTVPGGCWNSAGNPIFDRMSTSLYENDKYPCVFHYNYKEEIVNSFAGDMDIVTPWYFTRLEDAEKDNNLNEEVIKVYINYYFSIFKKFNVNGFRIDHLDHSIDYPLSINKKGNPISYRAPLTVFNKLYENISQIKPDFILFAEYMGWGDLNHPNLYEKYHENNIILCLSTDIVGEFRNNALIMLKEGNLELEKYNKKSQKVPMFSITHILDNHDRSHKDISKNLSEFTLDRAFIKWIKCLFLPGGKYANRPTLYLDGNQTHTDNKDFKNTFLDNLPLKRGENWDFFHKFDAFYRFSYEEDILIDGKSYWLENNKEKEKYKEQNNIISKWIVFNPNKSQGILVVINEWINDKQEKILGNNIYIPLFFHKDDKIINFNIEEEIYLKEEIEFCYILKSKKFEDNSNIKIITKDGSKYLYLKTLEPNKVRIFRIKYNL